MQHGKLYGSWIFRSSPFEDVNLKIKTVLTMCTAHWPPHGTSMPLTSMTTNALSIHCLHSLTNQSQTTLITRSTRSVVAILKFVIMLNFAEQCEWNLVIWYIDWNPSGWSWRNPGWRRYDRLQTVCHCLWCTPASCYTMQTPHSVRTHAVTVRWHQARKGTACCLPSYYINGQTVLQTEWELCLRHLLEVPFCIHSNVYVCMYVCT